MIVQCDRCQAQLDLSNVHLPESQSRIRCGGCQHEFDFRAQLQKPPAVIEEPLPPQNAFKGLRTGPTLAAQRDTALGEGVGGPLEPQSGFQPFGNLNEPVSPSMAFSNEQQHVQEPLSGPAPGLSFEPANLPHPQEEAQANPSELPSFSVTPGPPGEVAPSNQVAEQQAVLPMNEGMRSEAVDPSQASSKQGLSDFLVPNRPAENAPQDIPKRPSMATLKKTSSGFFDALQMEEPAPAEPAKSFVVPTGEIPIVPEPQTLPHVVESEPLPSSPSEPESHLQFSLPNSSPPKETFEGEQNLDTSEPHASEPVEHQAESGLEFDPSTPSGLSLELDNVENSDKFKVSESGSFSLVQTEDNAPEAVSPAPEAGGDLGLSVEKESLENLSLDSELPQLTHTGHIGVQAPSANTGVDAKEELSSSLFESGSAQGLERNHGTIAASAMKETMQALESSAVGAHQRAPVSSGLSYLGRTVSVALQASVFALSLLLSIFFSNGGEVATLQDKDWAGVYETIIPSSQSIVVYDVTIEPFKTKDNDLLFVLSGYVLNNSAETLSSVDVKISFGEKQLEARAGLRPDPFRLYTDGESPPHKPAVNDAQTAVKPGERTRFYMLTKEQFPGNMGDVTVEAKSTNPSL